MAAALRFQIRFHGADDRPGLWPADCRGKYLDEIIRRAALRDRLAPYQQAVETGRPVYTIHDITDRSGRLVHYERLLLPFSRDGATVDRILASFEFICPDGAFDSRDLMNVASRAAGAAGVGHDRAAGDGVRR